MDDTVLSAVELAEPPKPKHVALIGHRDAVWGVVVHPTDGTIVIGSGDQTAKLWTTQGKLVDTLTGHSGDTQHVERAVRTVRVRSESCVPGKCASGDTQVTLHCTFFSFSLSFCSLRPCLFSLTFLHRRSSHSSLLFSTQPHFVCLTMPVPSLTLCSLLGTVWDVVIRATSLCHSTTSLCHSTSLCLSLILSQLRVVTTRYSVGRGGASGDRTNHQSLW